MGKGDGRSFKTRWAFAIARAEGLTPAEKFTGTVLSYHGDADGRNVFPSLATIAAETNQSQRTVERHVPKLVRLGWFAVEAPAIQGVRGSKYRLAIPDTPDSRDGGQAATTPDRHDGTPDSRDGRVPTAVTDNHVKDHDKDHDKKNSSGELVVAGIRFLDLPEPNTFAAGLPTVAPVGAPSPEQTRADYAAALARQVPVSKPTYENPYAVERSKTGYNRSMQNEIEILREDPRFQRYIEMVESGELRDWQDVPPQLQQWAARRLQSR